MAHAYISDSELQQLGETIDYFNQKTMDRIKWIDELSRDTVEDCECCDRIIKEFEHVKQELLQSGLADPPINPEKEANLGQLLSEHDAKTKEEYEALASRRKKYLKKDE